MAWANDDLVYWRIYASLGFNEFIQYEFIEVDLL